MRFLAWNDGRVVEASQLQHDAPYLLYRIHSYNHIVYNAVYAVKHMQMATEYYFGFNTLVKPSDVERIATKLLEVCFAPKYISVPIDLRINIYGELSITVCDPSYGKGYYMRALRPALGIVEASYSKDIVQTSVSVATDYWVQGVVKRAGGDEAVVVDKQGLVVSLAWRLLFIVTPTTVYTPMEYDVAEFKAVRNAVKATNLQFVVCDIPQNILTLAEEIFTVDAMGVTSYSRIKDTPLMMSKTNIIVQNMVL